MSDTWYRDPPDIPPYEDWQGKLWTVDGQCLNPDPPQPPTWLDEWPEDLQSVAFTAAVQLEFAETYQHELNRRLDEVLGVWPPPR